MIKIVIDEYDFKFKFKIIVTNYGFKLKFKVIIANYSFMFKNFQNWWFNFPATFSKPLKHSMKTYKS